MEMLLLVNNDLKALFTNSSFEKITLNEDVKANITRIRRKRQSGAGKLNDYFIYINRDNFII